MIFLSLSGIEFSFTCYSDLIDKIANKIVDILYLNVITEDEFQEALEITKVKSDGISNLQPYHKMKLIFQKIIKKNITYYTEAQKILNNTTAITYANFINNLNRIKKSFKVTGLFYGNINKETVIKISNNLKYNQEITNKSALSNSEISSSSNKLNIKELNENFKYHKIFNGSYVYREHNDLKTEVNNLIANYYQLGKRDYKTSLMSNLIDLAWGNMFFYDLRTVKQLGYVVSAQKSTDENYMVK